MHAMLLMLCYAVTHAHLLPSLYYLGRRLTGLFWQQPAADGDTHCEMRLRLLKLSFGIEKCC